MEDITELENYVETKEYKDPFPPIENTIFYEKVMPNKQLGVWTNDSHVAGENGWYNNQLSIDDIEKGYNGLTYLKGYAPAKPLQTAKDEKHAELKSIMQTRRNAIQVEFGGDTFDANESAQENMIVLLKAFDLGAPAVQIRSATEVTHTFDKDTCQQLSLVMLQAVQALYAEYWELKNRLAACETIAEVEAITWPEGGK